MVAELSKVLESANFPALKRAFKLRIPGGVQLPDDLKAKIKEAKELDDLLEALFESKYWNFADLRLVGVLVMSSGIREAKTLVDKYKEVFFSTKLVDVLNVCTHTVLPPNQHKEYVCRVGSKISKEPDEITVADLAHYCTALETVIMDINEGSCVLEHVEKGCIELHWLIPIHCRYHAYKSALNNRHKFHSLHLQYLKIETYPPIQKMQGCHIWFLRLYTRLFNKLGAMLQQSCGKHVFDTVPSFRQVCARLPQSCYFQYF